MAPELNVQKSGADKAATRSGGHWRLEFAAMERSWLCQNSTIRMSIGSTLWLSRLAPAASMGTSVPSANPKPAGFSTCGRTKCGAGIRADRQLRGMWLALLKSLSLSETTWSGEYLNYLSDT